MTKAGDRILEAATEALKIARGQLSAARIYNQDGIMRTYISFNPDNVNQWRESDTYEFYVNSDWIFGIIRENGRLFFVGHIDSIEIKISVAETGNIPSDLERLMDKVDEVH